MAVPSLVAVRNWMRCARPFPDAARRQSSPAPPIALNCRAQHRIPVRVGHPITNVSLFALDDQIGHVIGDVAAIVESFADMQERATPVQASENISGAGECRP
jgi:hypothetical protein